jgi:hypothetical protein
MQELLKDKTEVTEKEICELIDKHDKIIDVKRHTYYSKSEK